MRFLRWLGHLWFGDGIRSALRWVALYLALLGAAVAYGFHWQIGEAHRRCELGNKLRAEAVILGVEVLIESVPDADPADAARYRHNAERRLDEVRINC